LKSNIGHTQSAAGVAGVIKMVMAMRHGVVPRSLHLGEPSSQVDWAAGAVELLAEQRVWPETGRPRRAGVSSFGISGTNAHTILEQAPDLDLEQSCRADGQTTTVLWAVSGKTEPALRAQANKLLSWVAETPGLDTIDVGNALIATRAAFAHRAVVIGQNVSELKHGLAELARGVADPGVVVGSAAVVPKVAVLFAGQGGQRTGMGRVLYGQFPVFAEALDEVLARLDVREALFGEDEEALERTGNAQPALFAFEVALFRLLESWGLRPDYLVGHSVGEITAAHIAGVLSLDDACELVRIRARLMQALPAEDGGGRPAGAMVALTAAEVDVLPWLDDRVSIAAVNGPSAVVVAGDEDAVLGVAARFDRWKRLRVSHAFHSPHMDPMLAEFEESIAELSFQPPSIPIISTVTGAQASPEELCAPEYWVRHARGTVRFADALRSLDGKGVHLFAEVGPDGALSAMGPASVDAVFVPAMRKGWGEVEGVTAALAGLYVAGVAMDVSTALAGSGTRHVDLPTYAFQRERFWPKGSMGSASEPVSLGLSAVDHPLLGGAVELPDSGGLLLTGRLSLQDQPWLADHVVLGSVLLPGSAFLELAIRAADEAGCDRVEELTLSSPLVLPEHGAVRIQLAVGAPEESGSRSLNVFSRGEGASWTLHATGLLGESVAVAPVFDESVWPPDNAEQIDLSDFYGGIADAGLEYGPVFHGLGAVWRRGDVLLAEVNLPESERSDAASFGLHPALLEAVAHVIPASGSAVTGLPVSWAGVSLYASGVSALRVRLTPADSGAVSIALADAEGRPVASVESLVLGPVTAGQLTHAWSSVADALFRVSWKSVPEKPAGDVGLVVVTLDLVSLLDQVDTVPDVVLVPVTGSAEAEVPDAVQTRTAGVLSQLQRWLVEDRCSASLLVFVTRGAMAVGETGEDPDLAGAAVWGLVRSAQLENPGRFVLMDIGNAEDDTDDDCQAARVALPAALASGEPQVVVREGVLYIPRLARIPSSDLMSSQRSASGVPASGVPAPDLPASEDWPVDGTVLITGWTSGPGYLVARHLVSRHGVRHLLLASRRGERADGVAELVEELRGFGAQVTVVVCDVGDRAAVAGMLAAIASDHPLKAIVHAAGVLDDGAIQCQDDERLSTVLRPKVAAAWHLHELTRHLELSAFVLFSSAAGTFGSLEQGNYAAANAFLDALARHRRMRGLPAQALAWGAWTQVTGMTGTLADADADAEVVCATQLGMPPLSAVDGLALFDAARACQDAVVVPMKLDLAVLRESGLVPSLVRGLIRPASRVAVSGAEPQELTGRLAEMPDAERDRFLLDWVRTRVAAVLGHTDAESIAADTAFPQLGFDSLTAVELGKQINAATGLSLPATVVFDHPTSTDLAGYLAAEIAGSSGGVASPDVVCELYGQAIRNGDLDGGTELLTAVAKLRPKFEYPVDQTRLPQPVRLSDGAGPHVVCIGPFVPLTGPHVYARLAAAFAGSRLVSALTPAGYSGAEQLPASAADLVAAQSETVALHVGDEQLVLIGISSGGILAYEIAKHLEKVGIPVRSVVLLDTYTLDDPYLTTAQEEFSSHMLEREGMLVGVDSTRLSAFQWAFGLFMDWRPRGVRAPTLLVRATEPMDVGRVGDDWQTSLDSMSAVVDVPGDHFTILEDHSSTTAQAVDEWLASQ
jgi:polyene macrolide polyketide synthase